MITEDLSKLSDEEIMNIDLYAINNEEIKEDSNNDEKLDENSEELENTKQRQEEEKENSNNDSLENDLESENNNEQSEDTKVDEKKEEIDYKSFYEKANKPLKFKGKEIKIENPDELIQLAQQGMNYADKINKIKPHTKFINALEQNDLLDRDSVNQLIAIAKGDKEAIKAIIKKHEIDLLDLDLDNVNYNKQNYIPTENQISFNEVISSVSSNDIGKNLIEEIKNNYDEKSQEYLSKKPQYIQELAQHKESGAYDIIVSEIEKQKLLGNIDDTIPFIEIYGKVGYNIMQQMAKDNNITNRNEPISKKVTKVRLNESSKNIDQKVNKISSVKALNGTTENINNNLGNMSDEEFLKQFDKMYKNATKR